MKTPEEQSKGLSECFNEQNAHVSNRLAEFLQMLDELLNSVGLWFDSFISLRSPNYSTDQ